MPPRRCWREKGHHPREDSPPECRHRPKLHNSSTAAQTRMLSTGEFWARLGQPLACTSISSVVVVSAPTRRTTCLKLPSFRSRAACQVVRSSSAKNLSSQNTLESQGFRRMFKRYLFGTTFASSSPLTPATQSGLCGAFIPFMGFASSAVCFNGAQLLASGDLFGCGRRRR